MISKLKSHAIRFVKNDDGMELLQLAIVVVISVALIAAVSAIATAVNSKMNTAADVVENDLNIENLID